MLHSSPQNLKRAVPVQAGATRMWVEESDLQRADLFVEIALEKAKPRKVPVRIQRNAKGRIVRAWLGHQQPSAYPSNAGNCYVQELSNGHVYALTGVRA